MTLRKTLIRPWEDGPGDSHGPVRIIQSKPVAVPAVPVEDPAGNAGYLRQGGRIGRGERAIACGDCGVTFQAKSPNARWCAECGKRRLRAATARWMRKKGSKTNEVASS